MFGYNNQYKEEYNKLLNQLNNFGSNFRNDEDKITALSLINRLKAIAYKIEPQDSVDYFNR